MILAGNCRLQVAGRGMIYSLRLITESYKKIYIYINYKFQK